jgi:hypothetical protein
MRPAMTPPELDLFRNVLASSAHYVEFGCGGSTAYAAFLVSSSIVSVDSSADWIAKVEAFCNTNPIRTRPKLTHVDIGQTGEFGYPSGESNQARWPDYYNNVWAIADAAIVDTYLVDGRFRVACALSVLLNAAPGALLLIHDYANRPAYHLVAEFAHEIVRAENLSVFRRSSTFHRAYALECLSRHALDTR